MALNYGVARHAGGEPFARLARTTDELLPLLEKMLVERKLAARVGVGPVDPGSTKMLEPGGCRGEALREGSCGVDILHH